MEPSNEKKIEETIPTPPQLIRGSGEFWGGGGDRLGHKLVQLQGQAGWRGGGSSVTMPGGMGHVYAAAVEQPAPSGTSDFVVVSLHSNNKSQSAAHGAGHRSGAGPGPEALPLRLSFR